MKKEIIDLKGSRPIFYKSFGLEIKSVDEEKRTVSGYLASFSNIDSDKDMLIKGCFAKSISERGPGTSTARKIAFLWMHDMKEPLGKFTKLQEDNTGLYFEAVIDKIPLGDRALEQYASGTLNQHSIGYKYIWDKLEYDETQDCFIVKEVDLFEGSVVTLGCNENTPFMGMKSTDLESQRNQLIKETESCLKGIEYDKQYQIRQLIAKHISLAETEPIESLKTEISKPDESSFNFLLGK